MADSKRQMPSYDEVKGRAKEAAGVATDDPDLEREGKTDRVAGKVKKTASKAVDKARDLVRGTSKQSRRR